MENKKRYLLGIDIGATGCKSCVYDRNAHLISSGYAEYSMNSPKPGWVEESPQDWWRAVCLSVKQCLSNKILPDEILSIGIGCTAATIAVDKKGEPLYPAIMLIDRRAVNEVRWLENTLGSDKIFRVTGNRLAPGVYSTPTILWMRKNLPDIFKRVYKFLTPSGYIIYKLTGKFTMNYPRGTTTLLMDIRKNKWDSEILGKLAISEELLPELFPSTAIAGNVTPQASDDTGLSYGTPVVAGCSDTTGAAIGSGIIEQGDSFIILGTCARLSICKDIPEFDSVFINCCHAVPKRWISIAAMNGTGLSLRWFRDVFGSEELNYAKKNNLDVYDIFSEKASHSPPGAKGLVYLPYICGERTPVWDPLARAAFIGLDISHTKEEILRSILEATAFALRQNLEIFRTNTGLSPSLLKIGGGGGRSKLWRQIIADVTQIPVAWMGERHIETLGAALIAGVGAGIYSNFLEAVKFTKTKETVQKPNKEYKKVYDELYSIYINAYPNLKELFHKLSKIDEIK